MRGNNNTIRECPVDELAAYIDGEMADARALMIEEHLAGCSGCRRRLTDQKLFLCGLNASLSRETEIELPANFAKVIAVNAESSVTGLRPARERRSAVYVSIALLVFGVIALGPDAGRLFDAGEASVDRVGAVASIFGRAVYSFFLGMAIILRSVTTEFGPAAGTFLIVPVAVIALIYYFSRKTLRAHRA
ncbi:MAG: zf-HC2 domain-containing protein [Pyrinomonadaceae bacterium]